MCRINKIFFGGGDQTDEWMMTTSPKGNIQNMAMMNPITKYRAALSSASAKAK
jgi:hypothetical protein